MNKVKVTRNIPVNGDPFFKVIMNGESQAFFSFQIDMPETSSYNEEKNRLAAMALAAKLENGNTDSEEIIYESPTE